MASVRTALGKAYPCRPGAGNGQEEAVGDPEPRDHARRTRMDEEDLTRGSDHSGP